MPPYSPCHSPPAPQTAPAVRPRPFSPMASPRASTAPDSTQLRCNACPETTCNGCHETKQHCRARLLLFPPLFFALRLLHALQRMPGRGPKRQQRLRRHHPTLVVNLALRNHKIPPSTQHPRIRLDSPARHRLQIINLQLHRRDLCSVRHRRVRCNRRRSIRQRRQNPPVHHSVHLLVLRLHIHKENRAPFAHTLNINL